jgi:GDPmannose 4,6-dehydratase
MNSHHISSTELIFDKDEVYIPGRTSRDQGLQFPKLRLGNINAKRDWGYARDYVNAMFLMLQNDSPKDYVIATGETRTVADFLNIAFKCVGIENWDEFIVIDPKFYRPSDVEFLKGDSSKIRKELGWEPVVSFNEMVKIMIDRDI